MAFDAHKNLAYSSVASPPSPAASGVTLILQTGDGARFPTANFPVTIWPAGAIPVPTNAEIAYCTTRAGDTLTLVRAQETSSARTIIAGDQVIAGITVKTITDIESLLLVPPMVCQGRLTFQSGVPIPTTDQTNVTTIRYTPHVGNRCSVYVGGTWVTRTFSELSVAVPVSGGFTVFDVFIYDNAGVLTLEVSAAWNNSTAGLCKRFASGSYATLLPRQDGVFVKSTDGTTIDATRRYLGTFMATSAGFSEDSAKQRLLYNYYNRVPRPLRLQEPTSSWAGNGTGYRLANGNAANYVYALQGVVEEFLDLSAVMMAGATLAAPGNWIATAVGVNGAGAFAGPYTLAPAYVYTGMNITARFDARYAPAVGINFYTWLEACGQASGMTFYGSGGAPIFYGVGLFGTMPG